MFLAQRLGANTNNEYVDNFINHVIKYPGAYDEVWIPTEYGFPPISVHREKAAFWKEAAEKFRKNGITVSMQLSNTIGHGIYMSSRDCSGLVYNGSKAENIVGFDGTVSPYGFCWRGENFKQYIFEEIACYMDIKPKYLWIDDDFRVLNHNPVKFGCFCDNCMRTFNERYGSSFTREELVENVLHGDIIWRERFVEFLREGLYSFTYEIGELVHKLSPETALAYQYCPHGAYTGYNFDYVFDSMKESTGINPASRPGGGVYAYTCHDPNVFMEKAVHINWLNATLPEYVTCKCPEIENLPHVVLGKSPAGVAFETSYYFANGNTDMSYSIKMHAREPEEWYDKEFELFAKQRKYWERLSEYNKFSHQSGLQYFMSKEIWKKKLADNEGFEEMNEERYSEANLFLRDAIPIAFDKNDTSLILLHPETAKDLSNEEIEFLLDKNVITDGESIKILSEKGFDFGVKVSQIEEFDAIKVRARFADHPLKPDFADFYSQSYHAKGRVGVYTMEKTRDDVEIISTYHSSHKLPQYCEDDTMPYGISEAVLTTSKGAKWAVFGYSFWKGVMPSFLRDHILNMADYISNNALPARLESLVQAVVLPRRNNEGKVVCVSITNCTIGESGELKLRIRKPAGEKFSFASQYNGEQTLTYEKDGNDYIVTLPSLHPWSVGTVFVD